MGSLKLACFTESGLLPSDSKTTSGKEDANEMSAKRRANRIHKGSYLKKPWRIATDHVRLAAPLDGQLRRGGHSHAKTIGKAAKASEAYPPHLARCINDTFLEEL